MGATGFFRFKNYHAFLELRDMSGASSVEVFCFQSAVGQNLFSKFVTGNLRPAQSPARVMTAGVGGWIAPLRSLMRRESYPDGSKRKQFPNPQGSPGLSRR